MNKGINGQGDSTKEEVTQLNTIGGVISITHKLINRLLGNMEQDLYIDPDKSLLIPITDSFGESTNLALASKSYLIKSGIRIGIKQGSRPEVIGNIDGEDLYLISTDLTNLRVLNVLTATFELKRLNKKHRKFDS